MSALKLFMNTKTKFINSLMRNTDFHNTSPHNFAAQELALLAKGATFVPTPPAPSLDIIDEKLRLFERKLKLRHMYGNATDDRPNIDRKCYVKSCFTPAELLPPQETGFLHRLRGLLLHAKSAAKRSKRQNVSKEDKKGLEKLAANQDVYIRKADKNLGITIMDTQATNLHAQTMLADTTTYLPVSVEQANELALEFIDRANSILARSYIPERQQEFIRMKFAQQTQTGFCFPRWYVMPKVHKLPKQDFRPICPSYPYIVHETSQWVSEKLAEIAVNRETICSSSDELVRLLDRKQFPTDCTLRSADVVALYPSIPTSRGLEAMRKLIFEHEAWSTKEKQTTLALLRIVLTLNVFIYSKSHFLQINGTAMGTPAAVYYANLFMFSIEQQMVANLKAESQLLCYQRYIDDVFAVTCNITTEEFEQHLQQLCPGIQFTTEASNTEVVMLDMIVAKDWRAQIFGKLSIRIFQKSTNCYQYIPFSSDHPKQLKQGFILGELIRYSKRNTRKKDFYHIIAEFYKRLQNRGYPARLLKPLFRRATFERSLQTRLQSKKAAQQGENRRLVISLPFHPMFEQLNLSNKIRHLWETFECTDKAPIIVWTKQANVYDLIRRVQKRQEH